MSDPEALLADLLTPGTRATSERLSALVAALSGYVDHVTAAIAEAITGLGRAAVGGLVPLPRRRLPGPPGRRRPCSASTSAGPRSTGARPSSAGVVERAGEDGLARLLADAKTLPTPAEVDAPGLWLERIDLPEDPDDQTARAPRSSDRDRLRGLLGEAEVPLEGQVLPLGVAHDPLPVAPELGVVGRQQHQPGQGPVPERLDRRGVPEVGLDLPVGGHRAEVDDPDVADRRVSARPLRRLRLPQARATRDLPGASKTTGQRTARRDGAGPGPSGPSSSSRPSAAGRAAA